MIRAELLRRGWNFAKLGRAHGLHKDTVRDAIRKPYPRAERIVADAIGTTPQTIWPSRFLPDGTRRPGQFRGHRSALRERAHVRKAGTN